MQLAPFQLNRLVPIAEYVPPQVWKLYRVYVRTSFSPHLSAKACFLGLTLLLQLLSILLLACKSVFGTPSFEYKWGYSFLCIVSIRTWGFRESCSLEPHDMRGASARAVLGIYVGIREATAFADDRVEAITAERGLLLTKFEMGIVKLTQDVTKREIVFWG